LLKLALENGRALAFGSDASGGARCKPMIGKGALPGNDKQGTDPVNCRSGCMAEIVRCLSLQTDGVGAIIDP
jgi:hypothetical protein